MLAPLTSRQTISLAATALASGRGAGLPELLELIQTLSTKVERISIGELAELIEQDAAVAARLIGVANMIAHNPGITPLTTVAHAIHQIGFHRVRSLAVSLMLIESTGARHNPAEQRMAASRALCAGLLAQACARQMHAVDPETAFACATLRQLGRILLPVVSIEHYRAAAREEKSTPEAMAFRHWFGLSPLALSRALLEKSGLPADIVATLGDFQPNRKGEAASSHGHRLIGIAEYGGRLTKLVFDPTLDDGGYARASQSLAREFSGTLPHAAELLTATLDLASERLVQFMQVPGSSSLPETIWRRVRSRLPKESEAAVTPVTRHKTVETVVEGAPESRPPIPLTFEEPPAVAVSPAARPPVAEAVAASEAAPPPAEATVATPGSTPPIPQNPPAGGLPDEITLLPEPVRSFHDSEPWLDLLRSAQDGFEATDCAVFLRSVRGGPFVLAEGLGRFTVHHQDTAAVYPGERTVFGIALTRRETVVIHDARTASMQACLPSWFCGDQDTPAAFILVPLVEDGKADGLVIIGWSAARRIELDGGHHALLRMLRGSAIRLCRDAERNQALRSAG